MVAVVAEELPERGSGGRVAYIAGKKLGDAPKRNRAKRVLREAARMQGAPWQKKRIVLIARESLLNAKVSEVSDDINRALRTLEIIEIEKDQIVDGD